MKAFLLACIFCFPMVHCTAQTEGKNALFVELGGSAGIWSVNYENTFKRYESTAFSFRAGLGGFPTDKNSGFVFTIPLSIFFNVGKKVHKFETQIGQNISINTIGGFYPITTVGVGYKYEPMGKGVFFRVAYIPLISYLYDFQYQHWAGVSIGFKFKSPTK